MKLKMTGFFVCLAAVICFATTGWSQEASQPAEMTDSMSAIKIEKGVICQGVIERAPVGIGEVFAKETGKLYCFTHLVGAEPDSKIIHNWYYQDELKASVQLNVRSNDFRTWSSKTILPEWTGEWMVEILSADGTPLKSITFIVE